MNTIPGKLGSNITRYKVTLIMQHCAKKIEEEPDLRVAPSSYSSFLSCKQVLPSRAFHLHLCFAQPRRDLKTKVHGGLSVAPPGQMPACVISNTLSGFPQTNSVARKGNAQRQTFQCGLEMWPRLEEIQERKGIKIHIVALLPSVSSTL